MEAILAVAVIVGVLGWGIVSFNLLIRDRNRMLAGWSDIDVQLKRRHDLIPRLVAVVKQYARYERETLKAITELRGRSEHTDNIAEKGDLETEIGRGVRRLIALAEQYPDLKAGRNFIDLQENLVSVEDHLQYARRYYNGAVRNLNTRIESFPDLLIARLFRFRHGEYFQLESETEQAAPRIKL